MKFMNLVRRGLGYYSKFKAIEQSADQTIYRVKKGVRKVQQGDTGAIADVSKDVTELVDMYRWLVER